MKDERSFAISSLDLRWFLASECFLPTVQVTACVGTHPKVSPRVWTLFSAVSALCWEGYRGLEGKTLQVQKGKTHPGEMWSLHTCEALKS